MASGHRDRWSFGNSTNQEEKKFICAAAQTGCYHGRAQVPRSSILATVQTMVYEMRRPRRHVCPPPHVYFDSTHSGLIALLCTAQHTKNARLQPRPGAAPLLRVALSCHLGVLLCVQVPRRPRTFGGGTSKKKKRKKKKKRDGCRPGIWRQSAKKQTRRYYHFGCHCCHGKN